MFTTHSDSWDTDQINPHTELLSCGVFFRWWSSVTPKARLCFRMSLELLVSRAAVCIMASPADAQRQPSVNLGPSAWTSASRSSAEQGWRSLRDTATTHTGRSVFMSHVNTRLVADTITHIRRVCAHFANPYTCAKQIRGAKAAGASIHESLLHSHRESQGHTPQTVTWPRVVCSEYPFSQWVSDLGGFTFMWF